LFRHRFERLELLERFERIQFIQANRDIVCGVYSSGALAAQSTAANWNIYLGTIRGGRQASLTDV